MKYIMALAALIILGVAVAADPVKVESKINSPTTQELAKVAFETFQASTLLNHPSENDFDKLPSDRQAVWCEAIHAVTEEIARRGMPVSKEPRFAIGKIHWNQWGNQTVQVEILKGPDRGKFLVRFVEFRTSYDRPVDVRIPNAPRNKTVTKSYGNVKVVSADELLFGPCRDESSQ